MKEILTFLIQGYQNFISPLLHSFFPHSPCSFYPSCSEYALKAIKKYGALKGAWLAISRLLRCNPFRRPSYDPL